MQDNDEGESFDDIIDEYVEALEGGPASPGGEYVLGVEPPTGHEGADSGSSLESPRVVTMFPTTV